MNTVPGQMLGPTPKLNRFRPILSPTLRTNTFWRVAWGERNSIHPEQVLDSHPERNCSCRSSQAPVAAVKPCCKAAAVASASASSATVAAALPDVVIFTVLASTAYTALCFVAMALFPHKSASLFSSIWPLVPLALAYLALLVWSWSPDTLSIIMPGSLQAGLSGGFNPQFFPRLEGIAELFGRPAVTASWLLHILVINLFAGRWCLLEGIRAGIPTAHSVLLSALFGPVGLLSHYVTKALSNVVPALKATEETVTLQNERGCITILPYTEATPASS